MLVAVMMMLGLVYYRGTRLLQRALSIAIIASFLVGPLLSTFRLTNFLDGQSAQVEVVGFPQHLLNMIRSPPYAPAGIDSCHYTPLCYTVA